MKIQKDQFKKEFKYKLKNYFQMQQLKNKFIDRKQKAVEKFSQIRYNFLVNKNYRQQQQESRASSIDKQIKNTFLITK